MNIPIAKKVETFFAQFEHLYYKKGDVLIRADETPAGVYCLKKGEVKMYSVSQNGKEATLNIYKSGAFFPMTWAMTGLPNKYYYEATSEVELWRAPRDKMLGYLRENPDVMYDLLSRIYKGLDGFFARMSYLMGGSAQARVIIEILILAKRFGLPGRDKSVTVTTTEKDLAFGSGLTRETVSREIKVLKDKHLLKYEKNVLSIQDIQLLESELELL